MKHILKILSYLFILILLTSEDCSDDTQRPSVSEQQKSMFEELEENFTAVVPPVEDLDAMEQRSLQKFCEMIDYLNVYSDTSFNVEFRREARKMISKVFMSKMDLQHFMSDIDLREDTIGQILENAKYEMTFIKLDSASILYGFTSTGPSEFRSEMYYQIYCNSEKYEGNLEVVVSKESKQFGRTELMVWEQYFKR